jgi:hypothetical protein
VKAALPWLVVGIFLLCLGGFIAFTTARPVALVYAAIPAAVCLVVGGLVWSRGPA